MKLQKGTGTYQVTRAHHPAAPHCMRLDAMAAKSMSGAAAAALAITAYVALMGGNGIAYCWTVKLLIEWKLEGTN